MKILNIGSMNLDYVYSVDHIILPGETEATEKRSVFLGGKGINQSVALAKAGADVYHAGIIGMGGRPFLEICEEYGINHKHIKKIDAPDGHTIIQIDKNAQNSILLFGGTNQMFTKEFVDKILIDFTEQDMLLLQNEINLLPYIVDQAQKKGMKIVLNPSPFNKDLQAVDMSKINMFVLNEVEGHQLTGRTEANEILSALLQMYPNAEIILTLGEAGAVYASSTERHYQPSFHVDAVDTTAAGDTFTGYFLSGVAQGLPIPRSLEMSAMASAIAVTRPGAVPSIPFYSEVMSALDNT